MAYFRRRARASPQELGFVTHVVEDACRGASLHDMDERRRELREAGVRLVRCAEVPPLVRERSSLDDLLYAARETAVARARDDGASRREIPRAEYRYCTWSSRRRMTDPRDRSPHDARVRTPRRKSAAAEREGGAAAPALFSHQKR